MISTYEIKLSTGAHFSLAWLVVLAQNGVKIGVKTEKITISKEIRYCKPLILKGLQKNSKNISTQPLTVLITGAILQI